MSFPRYPKYKDSGVEWLGEVPEHWRTMQLRFLLLDGKDGIRIGPFGSSIKIEHLVSEGIKVYGQENVIYRDFEAGDRRITEGHFCELSEYEIRGGDVLVTMAGTAGRCQAVPDRVEKGIIDSHLVRMRFPTEGVHAPFIPHLIESAAYVVAQIQVAWRGTTMQGLNSTIIKHLAIAIPGLDEQRAISSFLDRETAKIDALIAEQQRLIELLQEKRQAVISHAVTKGLNPDAPMKDSGIEWLGEVPEHWAIVALRRVVSSSRRITYGIVQPGPPDDSGRYMVRGQDYSAGWVTPDTIFRVSDAVESAYERSRLRAGDLVMTIVGAGVGNTAVIPKWLDGANITQTTARIAIDSRLANPRFVKAVLESAVGKRSVGFYAKGAAQPGLNLEHVKLFSIPLPPVREQSGIAEHLERACENFDILARETSSAINLLQERRSSLISAAVTGQIDVRGLANSEAA